MPKANVKLGAAHVPLNKVVRDALRERVLSGEFEPGERLPEERLSEELGVSRMPVREALRALAAEGLVTLEPRRGASVPAHTDAQVQELVEVRATLEGLNARLAAKRHDPKQIAGLERIVEASTRITEKSDLAEIQQHNERFHAAVEDIAANSVLMGIVRSLRDRTALIFAKQSRARVRQNWEEHAGIMRAIIAGDAELAGLLATRHVFNAAQMPEKQERTPRPPSAAALKRATGS
jgi:DNA-binding GntR family transcriptional regulator